MAGLDNEYSPSFVKIPYDVFLLLCHAHVLQDAKPSEMLELKRYLSDKMRRLYNHYSYVPRAQRPPASQNDGPTSETDNNT